MSPFYDRVEAPATPAQKQMLAQLSPQQILSAELAGEKIQSILTRAPGNDAPIGGLKVITESGAPPPARRLLNTPATDYPSN